MFRSIAPVKVVLLPDVAPVPHPTKEKTPLVVDPVPVPTAVKEPEFIPVAVGAGVGSTVIGVAEPCGNPMKMSNTTKSFAH